MNTSILIYFIIAIAVSTLMGYFVALLLWPSELPRRLAWAFAPGIGAGMSSFISFLFRRPIFTVEFLLLPVLFLSCVFLHRLQLNPLKVSAGRAPILALALVGACGLAMSLLILRADRIPHGETDGWAIWNSHARVIYRAGPNWTKLIPYTFHGDYPLLTPSLTARLWRYAGIEASEAGAVVGISFALSAVAVLVTTLSELCDPQLGILMGLVLIGTPRFLQHATSQDADVPLSFFILSTLALLCLSGKHAQNNKYGLVVLAGFTAGCAGWTKNEGLLFILAACLAVLFAGLLKRTTNTPRFFHFSAGLMLPLAIIMFFKIAIAPQNDLVQDRHFEEVIQKIMTSSRHRIIFDNVVHRFWSFGSWAIQPIIPVVALVALRGVNRAVIQNVGWFISVVTLGIVVVGYYAVYVVTPLDLQYHLDASLDRLMMQLWPSILLIVGLLSRNPVTIPSE